MLRLGATVRRGIHASAQRLGGGHHYKGYNEPTGHAFGIKPAPPGYRRKYLWHERWVLYVFFPLLAGMHILAYYRPESE